MSRVSSLAGLFLLLLSCSAFVQAGSVINWCPQGTVVFLNDGYAEIIAPLPAANDGWTRVEMKLASTGSTGEAVVASLQHETAPDSYELTTEYLFDWLATRESLAQEDTGGYYDGYDGDSGNVDKIVGRHAGYVIWLYRTGVSTVDVYLGQQQRSYDQSEDPTTADDVEKVDTLTGWTDGLFTWRMGEWDGDSQDALFGHSTGSVYVGESTQEKTTQLWFSGSFISTSGGGSEVDVTQQPESAQECGYQSWTDDLGARVISFTFSLGIMAGACVLWLVVRPKPAPSMIAMPGSQAVVPMQMAAQPQPVQMQQMPMAQVAPPPAYGAAPQGKLPY